jgi:hypothetical protein
MACRGVAAAKYCLQMGYAQNTCYQWVTVWIVLLLFPGFSFFLSVSSIAVGT